MVIVGNRNVGEGKLEKKCRRRDLALFSNQNEDEVKITSPSLC